MTARIPWNLSLTTVIAAQFLSLAALRSYAQDAEPSVQGLLEQAQAAYRQNQVAQAIDLATQAIDKDPTSGNAYYVRGRLFDSQRNFAKSLADYGEVIRLDPKATQVFQLRGSVNFKLGRIEDSIADFDRFIALLPSQEAHHWQRGISYYYAGRYAEGRRQFELHQTVNSNDVENAVWHFLCVARQENLPAARAALIPIQGDARIPMMEIHALFAGKSSPEKVLETARAGGPKEDALRHRLFYAHLYLGLYYEVHDKPGQAAEQIRKAAELNLEHYMGDVARVHLRRLQR